jgi:phosphatidylinositol-3-phosphatase
MLRSRIALLVVALSLTSCSSHQLKTVLAPPPSPLPHFEHVVIVVEENQSYEDVISNTADMPYLNALAANHGLATNFYANTHPSINNYFYLTAGRTGTRSPWIHQLADLYPGEVAGTNITEALSANKKTWKAYAESLPHVGYVGSDRGLYAKRHNPFAYFPTVRHAAPTKDGTIQRNNIVPFEQFTKDREAGKLPNYSFVVPNLINDGHNDPVTHRIASCGDHKALQKTDSWLKENIGPLVDSNDFQHDGLLIIAFDEACDSGSRADLTFDPKHRQQRGGGHIAVILVSPFTPPGTKIDHLLHHENLLRLSLRALGVEQLPGAAANATDMDDVFKGK